MQNGGDGIYGAWSVPYLDPVMSNKSFVRRMPSIYDGLEYQQGLCPVAERIQSEMMVFKTNYRSLDLARAKADALRKTIQDFE